MRLFRLPDCVALSANNTAGVLTAGTSSFAGYVIGCSPILAGLYPANTTTGNVGGVGTIGGPIGGTAGGGKIPCGRDVLVADVMADVVGATTGPVGATGGPNSASFSQPAGPCTASNLSATALMFSCRRSIDSKS